ncbi:malonyl-ACP O-methyltransferase BioC [Paenibacillus oenotherae]|uniref:Malonyl-[acyl-carrier protein] O-methyltransferase n=1 Tax=Paenibacillus oenotherae TaxID=1435645 RepID=A0ABS7D7K2_9BACL|nr:malonyl-ACP O-methyltransferase BioC [Paenibacillus oenotherae]MBW7475148.1 malonyl-ACP O-methyltransferase BioC [Paenibacillus oenotherae]
MDSRLRTIQRQFNRSADSSYDAHANVQRLMAESLAAHVLKLSAGRSPAITGILEIGCGTGALTAKLLAAFPAASITAVDVAPAMLQAAQRRISASGASSPAASARSAHPPEVAPPHQGTPPPSSRVDWIAADIETWAAQAVPGSFDLIVSNACLQWLIHPQETIRSLRRLLRPQGLLACTTFGPDTFHELHEAFADAYRRNGLRPQRHGLSLRSPQQWQAMLAEAEFIGIACERSAHSEQHATVRDFLHTVKAVGASASEADSSSRQGLSKRSLFADMFHAYEQRFGNAEGVPATYDLLLLQACTS